MTHRVKVFLHTTPLHQLRDGDGRRDQEFRHYDSLVLATKLFDAIIERLGLEQEVNREVALQELTPLLVAMDRQEGLKHDPARHRTMVDRVIAALRNDENQREAFSIEYCRFDSSDGRAIRSPCVFALLVDEFHPSGGTVLRLSDAAINLYLRALDLDLEDAHAAAEAVVQSQLERGRFDDAVQSARASRVRSVQFAERVHRLIRSTRRDISTVDWVDTAPRLLGEAMVHLQARIRMEQGILETATERLDNLEPESREALAVAEVWSLVRDCRARHHDLQGPLMQARNVFLDEQASEAGHDHRGGAGLIWSR